MEWASTLLRRNVAVSGHRVLFVDEVGPGALAGLVPFLDLITAVAGETLNDTDKTLAAVIRQFENSSVELTVYSCKTMTYRTTSLVRSAFASARTRMHFYFCAIPVSPGVFISHVRQWLCRHPPVTGVAQVFLGL